jgi:hypothetical protein
MIPSAIRRRDREVLLVLAIAACVSVVPFSFYFHRGDILLYGDAVAHCNIARRVFDSQTPGLLQLGTVWLPLPHLLMMPFLVSDWAWRTGFGGALPSLFAYVLSVVGVFRLVRSALRLHAEPDPHMRTAAWIAAGIFALNPNLIYLQATPMTEALYLALLVWATAHFAEFVQAMPAGGMRAAQPSLTKCGLCIAGACLTRYDGWFLAAVIGIAGWLVVSHFTGRRDPLQRDLRKFFLLVSAVPVLWIGYNAVVYHNPLEFANGPYSAKAIERKTANPNTPPHPGTDNLPEAASYFLKAAEVNLTESNWHRLWLLFAFLGMTTVLLFDRRLWPLLILWAPLPFYVLSIAYAGVPIFLPSWWPYSFYNVRYGVELLPAIAVFVALVAYWLMEFARSVRARSIIITVTAVLVALSYASVWYRQPISYREAWVNSRSRIALESRLAARLQQLPNDSTILMYLGDHGGALQHASIPLRRVIYEGNHRTWKQPVDPEGLWERALANPSQYSDYVVAINGDAVSRGADLSSLAPVAELEVPGQPRATIYKTRRQP